MIPRMTSFAYTPGESVPVTSMRRTLSGSSARHCDARTSRTCDVSIPNASAPNAPCVDVWLSPPAIVMPGCVRPSSGPITCTIPCSREPRSCSGTPKSRQFCWSEVSISSARASAKGRARLAVGTMWSTVATVRDGNGTFQPRARSISNACGLVTSWTRCSPTKSCVCPVGSFRTAWRSQTFENSVAAIAFSSRRRWAGDARRRSVVQERQLEPLHETSHLGSRRHFGFQRNSEEFFPLDHGRFHPRIHQPLEESVMDLANQSWRGGLVVLHDFPKLLGGADGFASEGSESVACGRHH